VNQKDQTEIESSKASQDGMGTGAGPGQPDDDEGSITSGSPNNLLLMAVAVGLLIFAGLVFFLAAVYGDSDATWDNWVIAETILHYVGTGIFYAGFLVGLGTLTTARSNDVPRRRIAVAGLLSKGGAAVVILGVAQAVCIVGTNSYGQGWQHEPYQVAFRMASSVFEGGLLAGLALLCLRQSKPGGTREPDRTAGASPRGGPTGNEGSGPVGRGGTTPPPSSRGTLLSAVKQKCRTAQTAIDSRFEALYN
jgi:hypothetical protein